MRYGGRSLVIIVKESIKRSLKDMYMYIGKVKLGLYSQNV